MSTILDSSSFDDDIKSKKDDNELREFLTIQEETARFNAQIHEFNELCWDKCVDKPGNKLDSRTETCLHNCVDRFIDVSLLITSRFAQLLQKSGGI
ncbi:mitochondrial import inner membrane translocase subunit Tim8-like [Vespa mandarinia]|uniref:mitochondrial import inner membrane translocase subunit Tim8-like n=1 Tax=Vespa mandarinia TaxID=7446 RepID=UPI0016174827|nr:mitochondrial import inner membrane translocase subunit Tim8-like [Vespa mandarinia]XP_046824438.1 mitochondrial import inner membrane translocase subunit Tim8-like [Vespa crabro]XP_047343135.1 mitochondrial import inner membrane translocase subunit Tim8-like [Vespa velutina]